MKYQNKGDIFKAITAINDLLVKDDGQVVKLLIKVEEGTTIHHLSHLVSLLDCFFHCSFTNVVKKGYQQLVIFDKEESDQTPKRVVKYFSCSEAISQPKYTFSSNTCFPFANFLNFLFSKVLSLTITLPSVISPNNLSIASL